MPKKQYRRYTFLIKRTRTEPEITFTTVAKNDKEAIAKTSKRMQMDVTDMHSIKPKSVGKLIDRKEANVYTKERVKEIKAMNKQAYGKGVNLTSFSFVHAGTLRTMISKLKRNANVRT